MMPDRGQRAGKGGGQCVSHMHILCNLFLKITVGGINYCCHFIDKDIKVSNLAKLMGFGSQQDLNWGLSAPELSSGPVRGQLDARGKRRWRSCEFKPWWWRPPSGNTKPVAGDSRLRCLGTWRLPVGLWGESPQCQPHLWNKESEEWGMEERREMLWGPQRGWLTGEGRRGAEETEGGGQWGAGAWGGGEAGRRWQGCQVKMREGDCSRKLQRVEEGGVEQMPHDCPWLAGVRDLGELVRKACCGTVQMLGWDYTSVSQEGPPYQDAIDNASKCKLFLPFSTWSCLVIIG